MHLEIIKRLRTPTQKTLSFSQEKLAIEFTIDLNISQSVQFGVATLVVVAVLSQEGVRGASLPSTYQILSLIDKKNPGGPHFIPSNFVSRASSAHWTPFTSFPLHRVIII